MERGTTISPAAAAITAPHSATPPAIGIPRFAAAAGAGPAPLPGGGGHVAATGGSDPICGGLESNDA
jgi:hypothetical protein